MATIDAIQASGGDYTSPQAWYDAHDGDITSDSNAPYIGELAAEEFTGSLLMINSTTDSTHYFHLRAQSGDEFDGDFDGSYPRITGVNSNDFCVGADDNYTRLEHIVVGPADLGNTTGEAGGIGVFNASNILIDGCGSHEITKTGSVVLVGIALGNCGVVVRNCSIHDVSSDSTGLQVHGIFVNAYDNYNVQIYNNAIHDISGGLVSVVIGIRAVQCLEVKIINNVVGSLAGGGVDGISADNNITEEIKYNATMDTTGGTNSQDNITPSDEFVDTTTATMDMHMKAGGDCEDNGYDLLYNSYTGAPSYDCDDDARPNNDGAWSIGIDHHSGTSIPLFFHHYKMHMSN